MPENKESKYWGWAIVLIVIVIIGFIVFHIFTLGKIKPPKVKIIPDEFKESEEEALKRKEELEKKVNKEKSIKAFKRYYFLIRFGFVALWGFYILFLIYINWINNLEDALNYSEAAILIWLAFNFLTFGSFTNLNRFIGSIKLRLQNWINRRYNITKENSLIKS